MSDDPNGTKFSLSELESEDKPEELLKRELDADLALGQLQLALQVIELAQAIATITEALETNKLAGGMVSDSYLENIKTKATNVYTATFNSARALVESRKKRERQA